MHFVQRSPRCSEDGGICSGEEDTCADCQGTQSVSGTIFFGGLDMVITHSSLNSGHKALKVVVVALNKKIPVLIVKVHILFQVQFWVGG